MAFALAIPRFWPRDTSLPPPPPGTKPGVLEGFDLAESGSQVENFGADQASTRNALSRMADWLNRGITVYSIDLDLLLAQYLWYRPDDEIGRGFREAARSGRLRSMPHIERNIGLLGIPASTMLHPLSSGSTMADWWKTARWMDRWIDRHARETTTRWGPLASGLDVLGDAAVQCMSWKGMRTDADYIRRSLRELGTEPLPPGITDPDMLRQMTQRESIRSSLLQAARALREDGRMHPAYERQRLGRLMASNPVYHSFSADTVPSSRAVVIPDDGEHLVSMDVSMAELFVAGVLWKQRVCGPKAGALLADLLDPSIDIHADTGEILRVEAGIGPIDPDRLRAAGKSINFGLGNMASDKTLASNIEKILGTPIPADAIGRTKHQLGRRYPLQEWQTYNKGRAFAQIPPRVQALSGRVLLLPTKPGQRKPSLSKSASYQTQTSYADMHQAGLLAVVENATRLGAWPVATMFDELVLTVRDPEVMPEVADIYLQAAQELSGEAGLRLRWTIWKGAWGSI